jgi:Site-specific DNA methylase
MLIKRLEKIHWNQVPKIISLFSGCGGMDLPFHYTGFKLVWAIDSDFMPVELLEGIFLILSRIIK